MNMDGSLCMFVPHLRRMKSMTEAEMVELKKLTCPTGTGEFNKEGLLVPATHFGDTISYEFMAQILEYLDSRGLDYRGLIDKGEAIEVQTIEETYV